MQKFILFSVVMVGLTGCISVSGESKEQLTEQLTQMATEIQKEKQELCKTLVQKHGWSYTNTSCTKKKR